MTEFEEVLETILEEYARRDTEGDFDTWEETDSFVKEKAEVLLAYANLKKEPVSEELEQAAIQYGINNFPSLCYGCKHVPIDAFKAGAKWGKQQTIANACDWLKRNADSYTWYNEFEGESGVTEDFVDDFKKEIQ